MNNLITKLVALGQYLILIGGCGTVVGNGIITEDEPKATASAPETESDTAAPAQDEMVTIVENYQILSNICASPIIGGALGEYYSAELKESFSIVKDQDLFLLKYETVLDIILKDKPETTELLYDALPVAYTPVDFECIAEDHNNPNIQSYKLSFDGLEYQLSWEYDSDLVVVNISINDHVYSKR